MVGARKRMRIRLIAAGAVALTAATVIAAVAFNDAIVFFVGPTELVSQAAAAPSDRILRLGGLVEQGSLTKEGTEVAFRVTDGTTAVAVAYDGVLPDLFREGQGVVAEGRFRDGLFTAETILAKHDENYMPPEVADALKKQGHWNP